MTTAASDGWWFAAFVPPDGGDRGRAVEPGETYGIVAVPPEGEAPENGQVFTVQPDGWQFNLEVRSA